VQVRLADPRPARPYQPYIAGGVNHIWSSGEPFVIVRPTQGDDEALLAHRAELCEFLSRETGSDYWEQMPVGGIPVVDDVELTDRMMHRHNLILVGPATANAALRRLMRELPVRERGDSLIVGEERLGFEGRLYTLFHYNPEAPQHYLAVLSSPEVEGLEPRMATDLINHEGAFGFHLKEVTPLHRELRRLRWDAQWRPQVEVGDEEPIPERLARSMEWERAFAQAARAATGSQYFLGHVGDDPEARLWDHTVTTWGDQRADLDRPMDFYRSRMTGAELLDLARALRDSLDWAGLEPPIGEGAIQPQATYYVCMPTWMPWDLAGQLHRNLPDVEWAHTETMWQHFERQQRGEGVADAAR
jgi:hypothetical protein